MEELFVKINEDGTLAGNEVYTKSNIARVLEQEYTEEFLVPNGWESYIQPTRPTGLTKYQAVQYSDIVKVENNWTRTVEIIEVSDSEKSRIDGPLSARVRENRNKILERSDWTQAADSPLSAEKKAEWVAYRQALRDITEDPGFPVYNNWPAPPAK